MHVLADSGYQGLQALHERVLIPARASKHHPLTRAQKRRNRSISRRRILVENVIGRIKVFRIIAEKYRNRRRRFGLRFNLIAALCNIENGRR